MARRYTLDAQERLRRRLDAYLRTEQGLIGKEFGKLGGKNRKDGSPPRTRLVHEQEQDDPNRLPTVHLEYRMIENVEPSKSPEWCAAQATKKYRNSTRGHKTGSNRKPPGWENMLPTYRG